MVQLRREFVFAACVSATLATALSIVSIAGDHWVQADLKLTSSQETNFVRYGLFNGVLSVRVTGSSTSYAVSMTCIYDQNVCALLCRDTKQHREDELRALIKGHAPTFNCPFYVAKSFHVQPLTFSATDEGATSQRSFINAGCYLSTLIFLSISIAFGTISSVLLFWNMIGNPVERVCSIYFSCYYLAIANVAAILAVIIWGTAFATTMIKNVAINYTLVGAMTHHGNPVLGFSYWINMGTLLLYPVSLGFIQFRKHIIKRIQRDIEGGNQNTFQNR